MDSDSEMDFHMMSTMTTACALMTIWLDKNNMLEESQEHQRNWTGAQAANAIINGPGPTCFNYIRMHKDAFFSLRDMIQEKSNLPGTFGVSLEEELIIFLHIISHNIKNRVMQHHFNHSGETISCHFNRMLNAVVLLQRDIIKPPRNGVPPEIMNSTRFFPYFKDCVGAIDCSHIPAMISIKEQAKWRNRKGFISQNVLASCSFDLTFQYVLAGWEGSASDSRILADALNRQHKLIVLAGKYYLVDAGFANAPGFLAPFRGVRYHLKEFRQGCQPRTKEELFNLRHSSLRNAIERAFGVLKARFPILKIASGYPLNTQVNIVAACCILHNHIINEKRDQELDFENNNDIGDGEDESEMHEDEGNESSEEENECDFRNESTAARREKQRWREFRLGLASAMWESYKSEQNIN